MIDYQWNNGLRFQPQTTLLLAAAMVFSLTGKMAIADAKITPPHLMAQGEPTLTLQAEGNRGDLIDKLDLDATQKQQIQAIRTNYRQSMASQRTAVKEAKETMRRLIRESTTSRSQLEAQYRTVSDLRKQLTDLQFQQMLDIREVLTPTQRAELAQHMAQKYQGEGDRPQPRWQNWFGWRR
ncbi:MAG: Spy/CpxP family protein refolding chaperone [Synechococcus sp.]|nr:Spy/CpxP family protein refolding chaperone [Synechococcus sp.]